MKRRNEDFEFFEKDFSNLIQFLPSWIDIKYEDITVEKIISGLNNYVFIISSPNQSVIYRRFLSKSQSEAELDNQIFLSLHNLGIAVKPFGYTHEFRIEEYFPSRVLKYFEINQTEIRRQLATKIAQFHKLQFDQISSHSDFVQDALSKPEVQNSFLINSSPDFPDYSEDQKKMVIEMDYINSKEEKTFITNILATLRKKGSYVVSHNDLWVGNILYNEQTNKIRLIDYELISYNFRGFDLGRLLMETYFKRKSEGPDYVFGEEFFPNEEDIIDLARLYLVARFTESENVDDMLLDDISISEMEKGIYATEEEKAIIIREFVNEIYLGLMINAYYQVIMAIAWANNPAIPVDLIRMASDYHFIYKKYRAKLYNI